MSVEWPSWVLWILAIASGPLLWLVGAVFFDFVHYVLHAMLRSRLGLLRALAYPHAVHHRWIDSKLEVQWRLQRQNIFFHIVPEFLTQLVFTGFVLWILPWPFALVLAVLQTLVFLGILSQKGLDINHRPIALLDAYRPGFLTPPAYHALHHVYPNAFYSAYGKWIDGLVLGGAEFRGRRFVVVCGEGKFGPALGAALSAAGARELRLLRLEHAFRVETLMRLEPRDLDVLILCDVAADVDGLVDAWTTLTRARRLPPELWQAISPDQASRARHYFDDVRLHYRALVLPDGFGPTQGEGRERAQRVVRRVRRGFHYVHTGRLFEAIVAWLRFRRLAASGPAGAVRLRHRAQEEAAAVTPEPV